MHKELLAVITGDIVESRRFEARELSFALQNLSEILNDLANQYDAKYELYRGDSFQVVCFKPEHALQIAVLIHLRLKSSIPSTSVRQSIGFGFGNVSRTKLTTSSGDAFVRSGTHLDKLKKGLLTISTGNNANVTCINVLTRFLDNNLTRLTSNQSQALAIYLESFGNKSHKEIAEELGKGRVGVTKLLNAANYELVNDCIELLRDLVIE